MRQILQILVLLFCAAGPVAAQDFSGLLGRTQALIGAGQYAAAVDAGKAAFATAETRDEKVGAARLVASAHFRAGQYGRASLWLRVAAQHADTPLANQAVAADFAGLRAVTPWTAKLSFSLAPSSNINNGSQADKVVIWGLPFTLNPDARALSGWEMALGANLSYRLSESAAHRTEIGLAAFSRSYALSRDSAAAAPNVSGGDYAFSGVELLGSHSWRGDQPGSHSVSLGMGRNWYAGDPYTVYGRVRYGREAQAGAGVIGRWAMSVERQQSETSRAMSNIVRTEAGLESRTQTGVLRADLAMERTASTDLLAENRATQLSFGYSHGQLVFGAALAGEISAEARDWTWSIYDPAGRHDVTVSMGLRFIMQNIDYYGFSPSIGIDARRTRSNISLFDRESAGLRFGLESRF